mmetsp:Transcript_3576/g.6251  ORF Transcript_3576/g.6251 Transcript_3576/m.6251 type:complete len:327 (+) Transcript_3576:1735-2715(+)
MMEEYGLECSVISVRYVLDALSCIHHTSGRHVQAAVVTAEEGRPQVKVNTQDFGSIQATVLLRKDAFSSFHCRKNVTLHVPLSTLLESLHALASPDNTAHPQSASNPNFGWSSSSGTASPLTIRVPSSNAHLELSVREFAGAGVGVVTHCKLPAISQDSAPDFGFFSSRVVASALVRSELLREALADADFGGSSSGILRISRSELQFRSGTDGEGAWRNVRIVWNQAPDVTGVLDTPPEEVGDSVVACTYQLSLLQRTLRALQASDDARIRINADGMLSVVLMLRAIHASPAPTSAPPPPAPCFIEFFICSEADIELEAESSSSEP